MPDFSSALIAWQRSYGRHDLPWQRTEPYLVWLSEIMLQQTQVATVIPYYLRFIAAFPTIASLAAATEEQVLAHWSGLGYYARARNLHRAAQKILSLHQGIFPSQYELILELPGIGPSTAAAICALAFHESRAIMDGNVKRILARYCGIDGTGSAFETALWQQARAYLPKQEVAIYTQALMDFGATLCTRSSPVCHECPVQAGCIAHQSGRVAELPTRRVRSKIPERQCIFLLVQHGRDIYLHKRASNGIWGGLWCFPQFDDMATLLFWCEVQGIVSCSVTNFQKPFVHTFTHFKLHITPMLLKCAQKPQQLMEWMDIDQALSAAIPVPVRLLLEKV
jgi:A/G-specific adenine glycosylase